jgi:hypothetical protein
MAGDRETGQEKDTTGGGIGAVYFALVLQRHHPSESVSEFRHRNVLQDEARLSFVQIEGKRIPEGRRRLSSELTTKHSPLSLPVVGR